MERQAQIILPHGMDGSSRLRTFRIAICKTGIKSKHNSSYRVAHPINGSGPHPHIPLTGKGRRWNTLITHYTYLTVENDVPLKKKH